MPYVNEYVPDEDVEKYKLNELWNKYNPFNRVPLPGFRLTWTVDRDNDSFFLHVWMGREEAARKHITIFRLAAVIYEVTLEYHSSGRTDEFPFRIDWRLQRLCPEVADMESRRALLFRLKDALTAYGYWGIEQQIPNTIVEFNE